MDAYHQRFPDSDEVILDAALDAARTAETGEGDRVQSRSLNTAEKTEATKPEHIGGSRSAAAWDEVASAWCISPHDPGLDRLVALKVPRSELLKTGQQRENFLHEARTAAKLKHPALVTVYEVQQEGELIYIVQEYIEGQNLAQWAAAAATVLGRDHAADDRDHHGHRLRASAGLLPPRPEAGQHPDRQRRACACGRFRAGRA